ncbi:hypothetical protein QU668_04045 [Schaalia sp. HMT-877]|nr:hypothetical protein QU668_04045 [Schaalia sp. HMT-877]
MRYESKITPPTFVRLVDEALREGVRVEYARLEGREACWDPTTGTVWIDAGLGERAAAAALAHELEHVRRGDSGPQRLGVERLIDEHVARRFIDPGRYALAERVLGPDPALIADELDLPPWVVEAWQRWARRGLCRIATSDPLVVAAGRL